jgi:DNA modification methylase
MTEPARIVDQEYALRPLADATPWPGNARRGDLEMIEQSMLENGIYGAILVQRSTGWIARGNHTHAAAKALGVEKLPMLFADLTDAQARRILLVDNRSGQAGGYDTTDLLALVQAAQQADGGLIGTGYSDEDLAALAAAVRDAGQPDGGGPTPDAGPTLRDRFLVPPFSVLDARQGYWQDRKRQWIALGIQSEVGRGDSISSLGARDASATDESGLKIANVVRKSAAPGGAAFPADHIGPDGKFARGDHHAGKRGAYTQPAAVGSGGLSDQIAPRGKGNAFAAGPAGSGGHAAAWAEGKKKVHAAPGGAPMPLDRAKAAHHPVLPNGVKDSAASFKSQARLAALQATGSSVVEPGPRLTWVPGNRSLDEMDDTSRRIAAAQATGTSIFDPTLTELCIRWFTAAGHHVLDPFAGGSVRGIVSAKLGRHYTGIELRPEQVAANEEQRERICGKDGGPKWICGDSLAEIPKLPGDYQADFVFSCPPYYDLEVYSQEAEDLSSMSYPNFVKAYRAIIALAIGRLKEDRFACFVVGEVRDPKGIYRNFVGDTVAAFQDAGARYYNEAILVTAVGSLPVRAGRAFEAARKLGHTHQNVIIGVKGNPQRATKACGHVEIATELADVSRPITDGPATSE